LTGAGQQEGGKAGVTVDRDEKDQWTADRDRLAGIRDRECVKENI